MIIIQVKDYCILPLRFREGKDIQKTLVSKDSTYA